MNRTELKILESLQEEDRKKREIEEIRQKEAALNKKEMLVINTGHVITSKDLIIP
ncbi:hypothetical protein [Acetobacterium bakii]|uniref:hypothetical protein n=1 Tax=Acetobacterium bakii TaxID=52689 RepID=UPI001364CF16|nr:hypothetical protein [Acetobacterium bakii]